MERRRNLPIQDLAEWLRYYRDLGFTHLYRREVSVPPATRSDSPSVASDLVLSRPPSPSSAGIGTPPRAASSAAIDLFAATTPRETLQRIQDDLGDCRRCKLAGGRKTIVFGSGNPNAELVFVGEGPGADEDEQGLPFVGRAGQLLTDMIEKGLKIPRAEVYICNIVKCRPPGNRKPEKDEVAACRPFVERQIEAVRPRILIGLGATAAETLLGVRESMGRLRGRWHEFRGAPLMITYHPAFLLRDPTKKGDAWADLKMVLARLQALRTGSPNKT